MHSGKKEKPTHKEQQQQQNHKQIKTKKINNNKMNTEYDEQLFLLYKRPHQGTIVYVN